MSGLYPLTVNTDPAAEPHIYAEDDAAIFQSMFGGDGVCSIGQRCAATVISNNKVQIADGVVVVGGHMARVRYGEYQDCEIMNGQTGYNRNDIIVAKFETTGTQGVDTYTIEVVQGTAVAGDAEDPVLTQGNLYEGETIHMMPLYRVKIEGLSIVGVEGLFEMIPTIPELYERTHVSNPNLLINADFQVWQRGTEFNTNVSTAFRYNADRWCHYTNVESRLIKKVDNGIYTEANLYQFLERKLEEGKPYVLSASIDGVMYTQDIIGGIEHTDISNLLVYRVGDKCDRIGVVFDESEGKTSHVVNWVKLEPGTTRTPFIPRFYNEELESCLRYYEHKYVMGDITGNSAVYTTGKICVPFTLREKRVQPSITFSDGANYGYVNRYSTTANNTHESGRVYATTWMYGEYELISDSGVSAGTIHAHVYADSEIYSAS